MEQELKNQTFEIADVSQSSWSMAYEILMILTQIGSLSQDGVDPEEAESFRILDEALTTVIDDVGLVYDQMGLLQDEQNYGMPIVEVTETNQLAQRALRRFQILARMINTWTPQLVRFRCLMLLEVFWGKVLDKLRGDTRSNSKIFEVMARNSTTRRLSFRQLAYRYKRRYNLRDHQYQSIQKVLG